MKTATQSKLTTMLQSEGQGPTVLNNLVDTAIPNVRINPKASTFMLLSLPHIPINRDFLSRVKKMAPLFDKGLMGQQVFTVFNVTQTVTIQYFGETITIEPGEYIADGNTRLESLRQGKIRLPSKVIALVFDVNDSEILQAEYFAIDNVASSEISSDLIRGAMAGFNFQVDSTVAKGGNFASALRNSYPRDKKDPAISKIAFFKNEIELLDECNIFNPTEGALKHQHFFGACMMAAKLYGEPASSRDKFKRVLTDLGKLDSMDLILSGKKWNGVTALIYQCANPAKKEWIPIEAQGKTNFASVEPSYDFYLYCIEMAMTDKMLDKHRGFKKANWEGRYREVLDLIS